MCTRRDERHTAAKRRATRGSVIVETAIGAVIALVLLVCALDVARLTYYRITLKHAVSEAARYAITGQTLPDPSNPAVQLSREDSILAIVRRYSIGVPFDGAEVDLSAVDGAGNAVAGGGGPGDIVTVAITFHVGVIAPVFRNFFPDHQYTFTTATTFRNEEFRTSRAGDTERLA
jgi:hypothetical protein